MSALLGTLEPEFKEIVKKVLADVEEATGLTWLITSGRRTIAEQNKLYAQGRTAKGSIVTNAKGGQSPHNFGLAADLCPCKKDTDKSLWWSAPEGYWIALGAMAEKHGLVWGGNFKSITDFPHIELPTWKETQALWKEGKINVV